MKHLILLTALLGLCLYVAAQNRYAVIISEIMADPTPSQGLPENEWIELTNTSTTAVNLQGWRIGEASGQSGALPNYTLLPGTQVVICTSSAVAALSVYGPVIAVTSFPSLDNESDQLFVKTTTGITMHAVQYNSSWYRNALKKEGGWSLEMIDTRNACMGKENWKASTSNNGGTPGRINSVNGTTNDEEAPQLQKSYSINSTILVLVFDEPLDSAIASGVSHYTIDHGVVLASTVAIPPFFNRVLLQTTTALQPGIVYTITATGIADCKGNTINNTTTAKTGLPGLALAGNLVINELLFNPRPNGNDYVELYNNGDSIIDLSSLYIANRHSSGAPGSISRLTTDPLYLFPGDYIALTTDADNLSLHYLVRNAAAVLSMASLPSFPDDDGTVIIMDQQGMTVDEISYADDWHFALIDNPEGVSLERIDPGKSSNDPGNWHSAATTAGYGTPGYVNSQLYPQQSIAAGWEVQPAIFSPDNDGYADICTIQYKMNEPGYVANITLFDAAGRPVRQLVRNALLSTSGYWTWDGLNDNGQQLPVGRYIVLTELFNLQGRKERFKHTVVLARKLR